MAKCYSKLGAVQCRMVFCKYGSNYISWDLVQLILLDYLQVYESITDANIHDVVKGYCNPLTHAEYLERFGNIKYWDVSEITNMSGLFADIKHFNQDISLWDTSKVTNMAWMFSSTISFNQDIGSWNTGAVTNMEFMFKNAAIFNGDIGTWQVTAVIDMEFMFCRATAFNQDIGRWKVDQLTEMGGMFHGATAFNKNYIEDWNVKYLCYKLKICYSESNLKKNTYF